MKRRNFVKKLGMAGLGFAAVNTFGFPVFAESYDKYFKRWIWITPESDLPAEEWKSRFRLMKEHGIHGVIAQVYGSHKALYPSAFLPVEADVLSTLIEAGRENGIEVHAWMWTMPNNSPFYIENHKEWYVVNRLGQPAHSHPAYVGYYRFMCPNQPEVQEFLQRNVRELSAIENLDGVHLDYIRYPDVILAEALQPTYNIVQDKEYPEFDYCYCGECRQKFKDQTGLDPITDMAEPAESELWRQFRYDSVSNLVNNILAPEIRNAGKISSAAVFPNWESVRQQWSQWDLDAYFPMLYHNFYNEGPEWIGEQLSLQISLMKKPAPVYAGLFLPSLTPEELAKTLSIIRESGGLGYSVFAYHNITEEHWKIMK